MIVARRAAAGVTTTSLAVRSGVGLSSTKSDADGVEASSFGNQKSAQKQQHQYGLTRASLVVAKNATSGFKGTGVVMLSPSWLRGLLSTRGRAVMAMSLSLAVHLGGYEFARAAVMALFTSDGLGFGRGHGNNDANDENGNDNGGEDSEGGLSALPMAVGCVSPFSIALLWFYALTLDFGGPAYALRTHTLISAATQILAGWILEKLDQHFQMGMATVVVDASSNGTNSLWLGSWPLTRIKSLSQPMLFLLFVFQNAYVQLLYAQHWAFISSVLTPEEGTKVFAPIAGLGSIGSTLAAGLVSMAVEWVGLIGLLYVAGTSCVASALLADVAFGVARRNGFEPKSESEKSVQVSGDRSEATPVAKGENATKYESSDSMSTSSSFSSCVSCCKKGSIFHQARTLFRRVPVLGALFIEVIISQCLSSLVNYIYLYKLKATIADDAMRAGWSGKFYAWINGVSGTFQFFIIPILLRYFEAHRIWLFMPIFMLFCTAYQFATHRSSGLFGASASFFAIKTMEYSLRGVASEMLYVSLNYESRYLGKKVVSLIAGKFGKSAMAVALSVAMVIYGESPNVMWYLLLTAMLFTFLWLFSSMRLHSLIVSSSTI